MNINPPPVPCQIPELNISCYGCCGRDFKSKEEVQKDLKLNTQDFKSIQYPTQYKMLLFRDRLSPDPDIVTPSGLCSNVVEFNSGCTACPLHPLINTLIEKKKYNYPFNKKKHTSQQRDPRFGYCDVNYECATFKYYNHFSNKQKIEFVQWVKQKDYDNYTYSMKNGDNILIEEFMQEMGWRV
ncbi:MAG: hypothetical protein LAT82_05870 [Nanoarchaeota archaeon]|nr:hypothetical protein [Nanoarchaeota archaeon]